MGQHGCKNRSVEPGGLEPKPTVEEVPEERAGPEGAAPGGVVSLHPSASSAGKADHLFLAEPGFERELLPACEPAVTAALQS